MTLTTYPATTDPSDLAALNVSRLIARLEHNLLSSNADLKSLRRSEDHRIRVGANIEYARANLQALERSLPQIKPVDRRHDLQSTLSRNRQTLKQLQNVLDEIQSEEIRSSSGGGGGWEFEDEDEEDDAEDDSSEDLLGTPEGGSTTDEAGAEGDASRDTTYTATAARPPATGTSTVEPSSSPTPTAFTSAPPPAALRNRRINTSTPSTSKATTATGTSHHPSSPNQDKPTPGTSAETESALSTDRAEQEDLTSSLLSLATQLKTSSQQFQSSLEAEKSVLARAAEGLDRTTGNLAAAEKRMGLLRRMTEGKGWWGRMMLYAWIFGLWVLAVLIVFVGPKLRF